MGQQKRSLFSSFSSSVVWSGEACLLSKLFVCVSARCSWCSRSTAPPSALTLRSSCPLRVPVVMVMGVCVCSRCRRSRSRSIAQPAREWCAREHLFCLRGWCRTQKKGQESPPLPRRSRSLPLERGGHHNLCPLPPALLDLDTLRKLSAGFCSKHSSRRAKKHTITALQPVSLPGGSGFNDPWGGEHNLTDEPDVLQKLA